VRRAVRAQWVRKSPVRRFRIPLPVRRCRAAVRIVRSGSWGMANGVLETRVGRGGAEFYCRARARCTATSIAAAAALVRAQAPHAGRCSKAVPARRPARIRDSHDCRCRFTGSATRFAPGRPGLIHDVGQKLRVCLRDVHVRGNDCVPWRIGPGISALHGVV